MRYIFGFLLFFFVTFRLFGQQNTQVKEIDTYHQYSLRKMLKHIEKTYGVDFSYLDETITGLYVNIEAGIYPLQDLLDDISEQLPIEFIRSREKEYLVIKQPEKIKEIPHNTEAPGYCILSKVEQLQCVFLHTYISSGISKNKDQSYHIEPYRLGIIPGMTEPDVFKTLQHLPGVLSSNETATELNVRGGVSDQNLILWDGIKIWHSGHLFGMISAINPNIRQNIYFYNKATHPRFGGKIGGIIQIRTEDEIPEKTKIQTGANALSADFYVNTPLVENKINLQLSGRRSFTDFWESPTLKSYSDKVFESTKNLKNLRLPETDTSVLNDNTFYYQDYTAKMNYKPNHNTSLSISSIWINSRLENFHDIVNSQDMHHDLLNTDNYGYSLIWKQQWNPSIHQTLHFYTSQYNLDYLNGRILDSGGKENLNKNNNINDSGISIESMFKTGKFSSITTGYEFNNIQVQHEFELENNYLNLILEARKDEMKTHTFYSVYQYSNHRKMSILAGFRYQMFMGKNDASFEPRYLLSFPIYKNLYLTHTGEYTTQSVYQIKETIFSEIGLENQLWALSNSYSIPIIRSRQHSIGLTYKKKRWTVDVDKYYKHIKGLSSRALNFSNVIRADQIYLGNRTISGLDVFIKKDFEHLHAWLTYSYNDIWDLFDEANNNEKFRSGNNIRHALNLSFSYKIKQFKFALGWNWSTGKPYTDAKATYDENNMPLWSYSHINDKNLPNYHSLDFSALYQFHAGKKKNMRIKTGFSLRNIYDHKSVINIRYQAIQTPGGRMTRTEQHSLGFTPNIFFRIYL